MNHRRKDQGLTLVEIMIALAIMVLALIGLFSVILHTTRSNSVQRENLTAMRAAEQKIEEIITSPFDSIFTNYSNGGNPGNTFDVTGLNKVAANTPVGSISFPVNGGLLAESETGEFTRMGSSNGDDLDLDGNTLATDTFSDSSAVDILPIRIDLTWSSIQGQNTTLTYHHILLRR